MNRWNIPASLEQEIVERDQNCIYCRRAFDIDGTKGSSATWEHIVNDARIVTLENIARCCSSCNASKGSKTLAAWLKTDYCQQRGINENTISDVARAALLSPPKAEQPSSCLASLGSALVESIPKTGLGEVTEGFLEERLDHHCVEGLFKDIPIVGAVVALGRAGFAMRDHLLVRKIAQFLHPMAKISPEIRQGLVSKLEQEPKFKHRVGEALIEMLDRQDSHRKPQMLGAAFAAYARGDVGSEMFNRLCFAVETIPWFEIDRIRPFNELGSEYRAENIHSTLSSLQAAGLVLAIATLGGGLSGQPTPVCSEFVRLDLDLLHK